MPVPKEGQKREGTTVGNKGSALAWAVALLAVVGLIGSLAWAFSLQRQVQTLTENVAAAESRGATLEHQARQQTGQVEALETTVAKMESRLAEAASQPSAESAAEPSVAPDGSGETTEEDGEAPAPEQEQEGMAQMMKMFEGEQGKKFAEMSADAAIPMYYNDLFDMLALPPDAEKQVRGILRDHMVRMIQAGADFAKEGEGAEAGKKLEEDMETALRKDLAEVLNENGLAIYDEYQENFEARVLKKTFDMQIGMFTSGLSDEDRAIAVDVMVEEMLGVGEEMQGFGAMNNPNVAQAQLDALERSRVRLSTVFDEQQMAQIDRLLEQQRAGLEMWQSMMDSEDSAPAAEDRQ